MYPYLYYKCKSVCVFNVNIKTASSSNSFTTAVRYYLYYLKVSYMLTSYSHFLFLLNFNTQVCFYKCGFIIYVCYSVVYMYSLLYCIYSVFSLWYVVSTQYVFLFLYIFILHVYFYILLYHEVAKILYYFSYVFLVCCVLIYHILCYFIL